jgi:hypothetical protein
MPLLVYHAGIRKMLLLGFRICGVSRVSFLFIVRENTFVRAVWEMISRLGVKGHPYPDPSLDQGYAHAQQMEQALFEAAPCDIDTQLKDYPYSERKAVFDNSDLISGPRIVERCKHNHCGILSNCGKVRRLGP